MCQEQKQEWMIRSSRILSKKWTSAGWRQDVTGARWEFCQAFAVYWLSQYWQAAASGQENGQASSQDASKTDSAQNGNEQTESGHSQAAAETKAPADDSTLPPTGGRGEADDQTVSAASYKVYTVADGETLYGICFKLYHNLQHIDEICRVNSLTDENSIFAGQKLLVP